MAKYSIGNEIKRVVKMRGLSVEDLAGFLNVSKPNIFDIYRRETIDTGLLERFCKVLNYNFFQYYSNKYTTDYDKILLDHYKEKSELLSALLSEKDERYSQLKSLVDKNK
jgi:transcriptional regulator with XRE-family HTH domain